MNSRQHLDDSSLQQDQSSDDEADHPIVMNPKRLKQPGNTLYSGDYIFLNKEMKDKKRSRATFEEPQYSQATLECAKRFRADDKELGIKTSKRKSLRRSDKYIKSIHAINRQCPDKNEYIAKADGNLTKVKERVTKKKTSKRKSLGRADKRIKNIHAINKQCPDKNEYIAEKGSKVTKAKEKRVTKKKPIKFKNLHLRNMHVYINRGSHENLIEGKGFAINYNHPVNEYSVISTSRDIEVAAMYATNRRRAAPAIELKPEFDPLWGYFKHRRIGSVSMFRISQQYMNSHGADIDKLKEEKKVFPSSNFRHNKEIVVFSSIQRKDVIANKILSIPSMRLIWSTRIEDEFGLDKKTYDNFRAELLSCSSDGGSIQHTFEKLLEQVEKHQLKLLRNSAKNTDEHKMEVDESAKFLDKNKLESLFDELFTAVTKENHPLVMQLISSHPGLISLYARHNEVPLLNYPVITGNLDMVRFLLRSGADVNYEYQVDGGQLDGYVGHFIHHATILGDEKMVNLLLDYGADPTFVNEDGCDVFDLALLHKCSNELNTMSRYADDQYFIRRMESYIINDEVDRMKYILPHMTDLFEREVYSFIKVAVKHNSIDALNFFLQDQTVCDQLMNHLDIIRMVKEKNRCEKHIIPTAANRNLLNFIAKFQYTPPHFDANRISDTSIALGTKSLIKNLFSARRPNQVLLAHPEACDKDVAMEGGNENEFCMMRI